MADNLLLNDGSGTQSARTTDRSGVHSQIIGKDFTPGASTEFVPGIPAVLRVAYTSAQTDQAVVTPTSGKRLAVTRIRLAADPANTVNPAIRVGFGTTNTPTGAGCVYSHPGLPSGLSDECGNGEGVLGIGTTDQPLRITCGAPTSGSLELIVTTVEDT